MGVRVFTLERLSTPAAVRLLLRVPDRWRALLHLRLPLLALALVDLLNGPNRDQGDLLDLRLLGL